MSKVNDPQLIAEAREWEGVAEKLENQNIVISTIIDALSYYAIEELGHIQRLLETTSEELYSVFRECERKHKAITASRFAEENSHV